MIVEKEPLSVTLNQLLDKLPEGQFSFGDLTSLLGVRAFGALMILLALPSLVPGLQIFSGLILLLYSFQMVFGVQTPWLPQWLSNYQLDKSVFQSALSLWLRYLEKIEHYVQPRLVFMCTRVAIRLSG